MQYGPASEALDYSKTELLKMEGSEIPVIAKWIFYVCFWGSVFLSSLSGLGVIGGPLTAYVIGLSLIMVTSLLCASWQWVFSFLSAREVEKQELLIQRLKTDWISSGASVESLYRLIRAHKTLDAAAVDADLEELENLRFEVTDSWSQIQIEILERSSGQKVVRFPFTAS